MARKQGSILGDVRNLLKWQTKNSGFNMRTFAMKWKKYFAAVVVILCILLFGCVEELDDRKKEAVWGEDMNADAVLITLYDNYQSNPELKTGWGFSCLVKVGNRNILFDTGNDSETLLYNMGKMGINPKEIDSIVLSHIHGDHTGGLDGILEENSDVNIFLPESFPENFKTSAKASGAAVTDISEAAKLFDKVYSTGELGTTIKEQSLIVETKKGLVVITGCAHPGVVNIVKKAKEFLGEEIYLVIGGFHLGGASDSELMSIIEDFRELGVKKAAPCHCSGNRTRELFRQEYGNNFIENGVGRIIEIKN